MRRAIKEGNYVKVISGPELYNDNEDKAKELGSTELFGKKKPTIGDQGDVVGISDGYVLVRFDGFEALIDISNLEIQKRREEAKFLVLYQNKSFEEYTEEEEVHERMKQLFSKGDLKMGDTVKVYKIDGYKEVKIKVEVAFT